MVALVRSGRERRLPEPPPAASRRGGRRHPQVVVIEHHEPREPEVQQVVVPVPVYVPVYPARPRSHRHGDAVDYPRPVESTFVPFQSGPPVSAPGAARPQPVYWGFGGKLRPDAWGQRPADAGKPSDPPARDGKHGTTTEARRKSSR